MGLKEKRYFVLCKHLSFWSIIGEISTQVKQKSGREEDSFGFLISFFPKPMQCKDLLTNNGALYTKRNFI